MFRKTKAAIATTLLVTAASSAQANPISLQELATELLANAVTATLNELQTNVSDSVMDTAASLMAESAQVAVEDASQPNTDTPSEIDNATRH